MKKVAGNRTAMVSESLPSSFSKSRFGIPSPGEFGWIWIGLALLLAVSLGIAPGTMTPGSILAMLPFAGILAIVATGQTLIIQQRGLDMSAIGMISLAERHLPLTRLSLQSFSRSSLPPPSESPMEY
jgi:ribose transport system permease protein